MSDVTVLPPQVKPPLSMVLVSDSSEWEYAERAMDTLRRINDLALKHRSRARVERLEVEKQSPVNGYQRAPQAYLLVRIPL
jgi:hypothetical protein